MHDMIGAIYTTKQLLANINKSHVPFLHILKKRYESKQRSQ